eukprot:COSAG01_NODE_48308_length_382_cov_1.349823_1_plen_34_part_01
MSSLVIALELDPEEIAEQQLMKEKKKALSAMEKV